MITDIAVVIPTIPPRRTMLARALASVDAQTRPAAQVIVEIDATGVGAPLARTRGLARVECEYVAFLDDDDEFLPHHLATLADALESTGADLVYPWFTVVGGTDPFPQHFGRPWTPTVQTTITTLARTEAVRDVGGFLTEEFGTDEAGNRAGEDHRMVTRLAERGYRIVHVPHRTWLWHHHGRNTSGQASRWR